MITHHDELEETDIFFKVVERELVWLDKLKQMQPSPSKAVVRVGSKGQPIYLCTVNKTYKVVTHEEVYKAVRPIIDTYPGVEFTSYMDHDGRVGYMDFIFRGTSRMVRGARHDFRFIITNGYGAGSLRGYFGGISGFCTNGLIAGDFEQSYRRHTSGLSAEVVRDWLAAGLSSFTSLCDHLDAWSSIRVGATTVDALFHQFSTDEKHKSTLWGLYQNKYEPQFGDNLFSVYNAMTEFGTFYERYKNRDVPSKSKHEKSFSLLARAYRIVAGEARTLGVVQSKEVNS